MIRILTQNKASTIVTSLAIIIGYWIIIAPGNYTSLGLLLLLLLESITLNYLCSKYKIIGQESNLPLLLSIILSALIVPELSFTDIIYGGVWLAAFFAAYEGKDNADKAVTYKIYLGILIGIAQTNSNISVFMFIPILILFIQTGSRNLRGLILSVLYFGMVLVSYVGILYVMEIESSYTGLLPTISFDYSVFNTILTKLFVPYIILSLIFHFLYLGMYKFRYPNKSKILNYTLLIQLIITLVLTILTANPDLLFYSIMVSSILLSYAFTYKINSVFVNASFASLICIAFFSLYLYKIIIL